MYGDDPLPPWPERELPTSPPKKQPFSAFAQVAALPLQTHDEKHSAEDEL